MEKQKYAKPYLARYIWYRWWIGGTWRKYGYDLFHRGELDGWYWTQDNIDYCCGKINYLRWRK